LSIGLLPGPTLSGIRRGLICLATALGLICLFVLNNLFTHITFTMAEVTGMADGAAKITLVGGVMQEPF
jgi:hypothetical protein